MFCHSACLCIRWREKYLLVATPSASAHKSCAINKSNTTRATHTHNIFKQIAKSKIFSFLVMPKRARRQRNKNWIDTIRCEYAWTQEPISKVQTQRYQVPLNIFIKTFLWACIFIASKTAAEKKNRKNKSEQIKISKIERKTKKTQM